MKNFIVRTWFTWHYDREISAESAEQAEQIAEENFSWTDVDERFDRSDLEWDINEVFDEEGDVAR